MSNLALFGLGIFLEEFVLIIANANEIATANNGNSPIQTIYLGRGIGILSSEIHGGYNYSPSVALEAAYGNSTYLERNGFRDIFAGDDTLLLNHTKPHI